MRFHLGDSMTAVTNYVPMAKTAEAHGFAGMAIPDSLIYPEETDSKYFYTGDGGRSFLENKPFIETFMLASHLAAVTEKLEFTFNVLKLPVRPPLYSAKLAASLAVLSNNRLNFGVGLSVWPEDYEVMGVPYENRGKRFDECIAIVRGLTNGGYFEFHGEFYDLRSVKLNPVPTKPLPILIGGHVDLALKRAARNDGWIYAGGGLDTFTPLMEKLTGFRKELGTDSKPFRVFGTDMGMPDVDTVKRYVDAGMTDLILTFRNVYDVAEDTQPLSEKLDNIKRFADNVVSKF
jgi:alkanesulfonate monooxygenase SsuD/methylene tetrahydromethanopterin reductase-like flavin-dependent oxidoreductase (luciferase family)